MKEGQIGSTDVALLYAMEHGVLQGYASFGKCWFHVTIWMQLIYSIPCMALPDSISLEPWVGLGYAGDAVSGMLLCEGASVLDLYGVAYPVALCNICGSSKAK